MYESFFGLARRPFAAAPAVEHYFPAAAIETARATLARTVDRGEGAGLAVGPSGSGKTLLCQMFAAQFEKRFRVALLAEGRLGSRRALFQAVLYELGQPYRGMDEGEARLALVDYLTIDDECRNGLLLVVDEAHTLPMRLLDELRLLTNVSRQGQLQVRLVLAGGAVLEERLASPKLESFSQRIVARCYLEAFNRSETQEYVQTRINAAGGSGPRLFSDEACQAVYRATDGVPRLINQVCDHAMLLAFTRATRAIEPALVAEAWADLQQLPTPWNGEPSPSAGGGGSTIEFGALDEPAGQAGDAPAATSESPAGAAFEIGGPLSDAAELDEAIAAGTASADDADPLADAEVQVQRIERMLDEAENEFRPAGAGPEVELVFEDLPPPLAEPFVEEEIVADRYARPQRARSAAAAPRPSAPPARCPAEPETVPLCPCRAETGDDESILIIEDGCDQEAAPAGCAIVPVRHNEFRQLFARLRRSGT